MYNLEAEPTFVLHDLPLEEIIRDTAFEMREYQAHEDVDRFAESIERLPPVKVVRDDDGHDFLVDGFKRWAAHKKMGRKGIKCQVYRGDYNFALLMAARSNHDHGRPQTPGDKRLAVTRLLTNEFWKSKSDRWIAEQCGVSHPFVGDVRDDLKEAKPEKEDKPEQRIGRNGRAQSPVKKGKPFHMLDGRVVCARCKRFNKETANCLSCAGERQRAEGADRERAKPRPKKIMGTPKFAWKRFRKAAKELYLMIDAAAIKAGDLDDAWHKQCQDRLAKINADVDEHVK